MTDLCQHCGEEESAGLRCGAPTCVYCWPVLDDLEGGEPVDPDE